MLSKDIRRLSIAVFGPTMPHEELWAGVDLKADYARFHFEQMERALQPPQRTAINVATGATDIDPGWQRALYAHLDAFLSATRSVGEVISCCFGLDEDRRMKTFLGGLSGDERDRRRKFRDLYQSHHNAFRNQPLAKARHVSEHRTGKVAVTAKISGRFGVTHAGEPTKLVPHTEVQQMDDPQFQFLARQHVIQPEQDNFSIDGQKLFPACQMYLSEARTLVATARQIAGQVHGASHLTTPY